MEISDYQLMDLGVDALFTHDPDGSIRQVNEPDGELAPRFFFGYTVEGSLWRFRYDLHPDTRRNKVFDHAVDCRNVAESLDSVKHMC